MRVADIAWDEVGRQLTAGRIAVLLVGAGAKEHGLHLPMGTDLLQAEWLCGQLAGRLPLLSWPVLSYGFYPAFTSYAGSASLSAATFEATVRELATGILGFGARGLAVIDTGISTISPVGRALAGFDRALHVKIHEGPDYRAAAARLAEQTSGGHADELETSRMLVIAPGLVQLARAAQSPGAANLAPGPLQHADPAAPNFSPSGATGSPEKATREKGEALLAAMLCDIEGSIRTRFGD